MMDLAIRQQKILEALVVPSLPKSSEEQQEKDLFRMELEEDLKEAMIVDFARKHSS